MSPLSGSVTDGLHEKCAIKELPNEYRLKLITHSTSQLLLRKIPHPRQEVGVRALPHKVVIALKNQKILQVGSALPYRVITRSYLDQLTECLDNDLFWSYSAFSK
jgi:hypothetical protein